MAETPRAVLSLHGSGLDLLLMRFLDLGEVDDDEGDDEDGDGAEQHRADLSDRRTLGDGTDIGTDHDRSDGSGEGVAGAAELEQLVALRSAAADEVQHRVDDRIQHTDAKTADERAQQVDGEAGDTGAETGEVLNDQAHDTDRDGDQRRLLVADLGQHVSGGDTHEEVSQEVHEVTHETERRIVSYSIVHCPDVADRGSHVGYECNHREEEEHRDDGHEIGVFLCHNVLCIN